MAEPVVKYDLDFDYDEYVAVMDEEIEKAKTPEERADLEVEKERVLARDAILYFPPEADG